MLDVPSVEAGPLLTVDPAPAESAGDATHAPATPGTDDPAPDAVVDDAPAVPTAADPLADGPVHG